MNKTCEVLKEAKRMLKEGKWIQKRSFRKPVDKAIEISKEGAVTD